MATTTVTRVTYPKDTERYSGASKRYRIISSSAQSDILIKNIKFEHKYISPAYT